MRLSKSIHESEMSQMNWTKLQEDLERDCMSFIKNLRGVKNLLYRGMKGEITRHWKKVNQRQDRVPRYIDSNLHKMMDDWSNKHWGFKARSQSTFTTANPANAKGYGRSYIIFPIGKFKYAWNNDVVKLYGNYDAFDARVKAYYERYNSQIEYEEDFKSMDELREVTFDEQIVPEMVKYETTNINKYLKMPVKDSDYTECILNCKSYYIIHREWESTLLEWYSVRYWRGK